MIQIIGIGLVIGLLFVSPLLTTIFGALTGWVVAASGLGNWVCHGLASFDINVAPSQLSSVGAALGFVGGFFKSVQSNLNTNR